MTTPKIVLDPDTVLHAALEQLRERERAASEHVNAAHVALVAATATLEATINARVTMERMLGVVETDEVSKPGPVLTEAETQALGKKIWNEMTGANKPMAGMEAVQFALEKVADKPMTLKELTEEVIALGYKPESDDPERAVRAAANRLRKKDTRFVYANRLWAFLPKHAEFLQAQLATANDDSTEAPDDD